MWAATEVRARVVDVTRETDGEHPVATITLQPTSTWRGHRAGQYVQVGVEINGARRTTRCFSISSAESNPGEQFSITVRAHDEAKPGQQRVSRFLVREAQPGQIVHLSQAEGQFTLTESPATPTNNELLMISGGSGITPVMSQIRTLLRDGYDGRANRKRVTFLHYARSAEDQIFAEELNRIAWQDNGIDVHLRHGDEFFSAEALARLVPNFRDVDTWACGPAPMMSLVAEAYGDSPRLRTEFFKVSTSAAVDGDSADGEISFTRAGKTAPNSGASLLEQAEAHGPDPGVRLPDGHLLLLRLAQDRGHRPQRADRRGVRAARRGRPHLRVRARRQLLRRPLTTRDRPIRREHDMTTTALPKTKTSKTTKKTEKATKAEPVEKNDNKLTPEQIEAFGDEIDAIRQRLIGELGEEDADYIRGIVKKQRQFEVAGRALMYLPPAWPLAVAALSVSKILDNMEIGHNVMHGQYDWMGDPGLNSRMYDWDNVCPRDQWKYSHNYIHHTFTNILGKDRDIGYGILRMDEDQKWHPYYLGNPVYALAADDLLRVGRGDARPRGREHRQGQAQPGGQQAALPRV